MLCKQGEKMRLPKDAASVDLIQKVKCSDLSQRNDSGLVFI